MTTRSQQWINRKADEQVNRESGYQEAVSARVAGVDNVSGKVILKDTLGEQALTSEAHSSKLNPLPGSGAMAQRSDPNQGRRIFTTVITAKQPGAVAVKGSPTTYVKPEDEPKEEKPCIEIVDIKEPPLDCCGVTGFWEVGYKITGKPYFTFKIRHREYTYTKVATYTDSATGISWDEFEESVSETVSDTQTVVGTYLREEYEQLISQPTYYYTDGSLATTVSINPPQTQLKRMVYELDGAEDAYELPAAVYENIGQSSPWYDDGAEIVSTYHTEELQQFHPTHENNVQLYGNHQQLPLTEEIPEGINVSTKNCDESAMLDGYKLIKIPPIDGKTYILPEFSVEKQTFNPDKDHPCYHDVVVPWLIENPDYQPQGWTPPN